MGLSPEIWGYVEIVLMSVCCFLFIQAVRNDRRLPWNWPFLGMLPGAVWNVRRFHEWCTVVAAASGGTFHGKGPWFLGMDMLLTVDPENVHHIMTANFPNYPKGSKFREIFDYLGDGIFGADLDMWKVQRKTTQFFMNHQRFHKYLLKTVSDKIENRLIPVLDHLSETGKVVDLQDLFRRFSYDTITKLATGYDAGCVNIDFSDIKFNKPLDTAEGTMVVRYFLPEVLWKFMRLLRVGHERKYGQACKAIDKAVAEFISRKRDEIASKPAKSWNDDDDDDEDGVDFLTLFITQKENIELPCDDKLLRDTILNLMMAGRGGIVSGLIWFFWLLSENPNVELKIREELIQSIKPPEEAQKWKVFDAGELNNLVYLHAAICESLRLYPPVAFEQKQPLQQEILPTGHHVRPNMKILFSMYAMGRMKSIWGNDCMEMKPERWISERGTIKHETSSKFFTFNAGPRICLGKNVSFMILKAVAATIIHNYHIKVVPGQQIVPTLSVILYIKNGLRVQLYKRWG